MENFLVLVNNDSSGYIGSGIKRSEIFFYYKGEKFWHRLLRKIILSTQLGCTKYLFSHWYKQAINADTIIFFDTRNLKYIIKWARKEFKNKRLIIWYWNSVNDSISPEDFKDLENVEIWSFDKADCDRYNFKFNTQFYFPEYADINTQRSVEKCSDVVYVGADKNRASKLYELKKIFDQENISYNFHLVKTKNDNNPYGIEYKERIKYLQLLEKIVDSKVIIDLVADWQNGLTLRPLEALYFKKKLITNMQNITDYDLYNKNNIFLLGVDDPKTLKKFINTPYDECGYEKLISKYSYNSWLKRF